MHDVVVDGPIDLHCVLWDAIILHKIMFPVGRLCTQRKRMAYHIVVIVYT